MIFSKFTCPFCIREYDKSQVLYVCPDCGTETKPGRFAREPIKCSDPNCGGFATLRVCPSCHETIPKTALDTPNLPFSIVGVSTSGKTNYITVMLHELGTSSGLRLGLGHQTQETLTNQNYNWELINKYHQKPPVTDREVRPQIWYIKNLEKKHGNSVPTYTFTIFDGAGEDQEKIDPSSTVCRYIKASKAIILTIDPLVLPSVRKGGIVDANIMTNSLNGAEGMGKNASDIINSVATYIKVARGIRSDKMLDMSNQLKNY